MSEKRFEVKDAVFSDVARELKVTRKVLEKIPAQHFGWKPHKKSMSLGQLAIHVATLPQWAEGAIAHDGLDVATAPKPPAAVASNEELLELFDKAAAALNKAIAEFDIEKYFKTWSFTQGQKVMTSQPRATVYRTWSMNHLVHHRGQLCVYLRLLDIPVPTVYFNSADDPAWVFE